MRWIAYENELVYQFVMIVTQTSALGRRGGHRVRQWLLDMMASGHYAAGAKLPTERAVAEQLAVPRSAVRNALAALEAEGAIVRLIGSGTFVARPQPPEKAEPAAALVTASDVSPTEIMEARLAIEPRIAVLAVARATVSDFERMELCNRKGELAESFADFEHWDAALHQAIAEATHNRLVIALYTGITRARDQADWGELKRKSQSPERREAYREEHRRIVAALRARDAAQTEATLLEHLRHVRQNLLGI